MRIGFSKIMVGTDISKESINSADYAVASRYNAELIAINVLSQTFYNSVFLIFIVLYCE
jgi:hypothetical protein